MILCPCTSVIGEDAPDELFVLRSDKEHAISAGLMRSSMKDVALHLVCSLHAKWSTYALTSARHPHVRHPRQHALAHVIHPHARHPRQMDYVRSPLHSTFTSARHPHVTHPRQHARHPHVIRRHLLTACFTNDVDPQMCPHTKSDASRHLVRRQVTCGKN